MTSSKSPRSISPTTVTKSWCPLRIAISSSASRFTASQVFFFLGTDMVKYPFNRLYAQPFFSTHLFDAWNFDALVNVLLVTLGVMPFPIHPFQNFSGIALTVGAIKLPPLELSSRPMPPKVDKSLANIGRFWCISSVYCPQWGQYIPSPIILTCIVNWFSIQLQVSTVTPGRSSK